MMFHCEAKELTQAQFDALTVVLEPRLEFALPDGCAYKTKSLSKEEWWYAERTRTSPMGVKLIDYWPIRIVDASPVEEWAEW